MSSYHCHDSLLDHQEDQELTEEERKVAWAEYNQEKKVTSNCWLQCFQLRKLKIAEFSLILFLSCLFFTFNFIF